MIGRPPIAGIILAGGRSSRMRVDKALTPLAGRPLIAHVVERLRPQVDFLVISANGDAGRFAAFDAPVVADADPLAYAGPLAGVCAAMALASSRGVELVATAPCDAPFLPADLVARLLATLERTGAPAAAARRAGRIEPLFALWRVAAQGAIDEALARGDASPRALLIHCGAAFADFEEGANSFDNFNDPAALAAAEARLAASG